MYNNRRSGFGKNILRLCMIFIAWCVFTGCCLADETILGKAEIPQEAFVRLIYSYNQRPQLGCSIEEFVKIYYDEAEKENIRADVALSQALLETGFLRFGKDVRPSQNNFCGLGTVGGGAAGCNFDSPLLGVRAHIQHLLAYVSLDIPIDDVVDPRFWLVRAIAGGTARFIGDLTGHWASDKGYAEKIESIMERAKQIM